MNTNSSFRTILVLYGFFVARIGQRPFEPCRAESRLLILKKSRNSSAPRLCLLPDSTTTVGM